MYGCSCKDIFFFVTLQNVYSHIIMRVSAIYKGIIFLFFTLLSHFPATGQVQTARLLHKESALCGEGAIWNPFSSTLLWVDIDGQRLFEWDPATKQNREWKFEKKISTVVPETPETVVFTLADEIVRFNIKSGQREQLTAIDTDGGAIRFNDGKCDPIGRLWAGTMVMQGPRGGGALYRLDSRGLVPIVTGVTCSNGIVWTKDKRTMYYIDTPTREIVAYDFNSKTGEISNRRVAVTVPDGMGWPDGMAIDKNDMLWVAHWNGGGVYNWDPKTGQLIGKIGVPAPNVTSCSWGGEDMDTLFITTARNGMNEELLKKYPLSGSLLYCRPGSKGVKTNLFKWGK